MQENTNLQKRLEEVEQMARRKEAQLEEEKKKLAHDVKEKTLELEKAKTAAKDGKASVTSLVSKLQVQLIEVQTENETLVHEQLILKEAQREYESKLKQLEERQAELVQQNERLNEERVAWMNAANAGNERLNELREENHNLKRIIGELEKRVEESDRHGSDSNGRIAALEREIKQKEENHKSEMKVLNGLLNEQVEANKRLSTKLQKQIGKQSQHTPYKHTIYYFPHVCAYHIHVPHNHTHTTPYNPYKHNHTAYNTTTPHILYIPHNTIIAHRNNTIKTTYLTQYHTFHLTSSSDANIPRYFSSIHELHTHTYIF